jgi:hypothetical protein
LTDLLDEIIDRLAPMPREARDEAVDLARRQTAHLAWVPNPGPQTLAYESEADELFYGGQAGGGKTDLGLGLALTRHRRSLILRRVNKDSLKLAERVTEIIGHRTGYNGQLHRWKLDERLIEFSGCEHEEDKQRFKGDPHDLIYFDEGTDFLHSQYRFIVGWNRSADPQQRCRVVVGSNPPTTAEGLWVIKHWAPWLDPVHPRPAAPGELRWFTTAADGEDIEVDGRGPHLVRGQPVAARSRSYIPARLDDNPDLRRIGYAAVLAGLPEELRLAYRDGNFSAALKDDDFQVIPTAWIEAAQARWRADAGRGTAMTAMTAMLPRAAPTRPCSPPAMADGMRRSCASRGTKPATVALSPRRWRRCGAGAARWWSMSAAAGAATRWRGSKTTAFPSSASTARMLRSQRRATASSPSSTSARRHGGVCARSSTPARTAARRWRCRRTLRSRPTSQRRAGSSRPAASKSRTRTRSANGWGVRPTRATPS